MGNNVREEIMDLDLNSDPSDPSNGSVLGLGSLLNELETAHGRIEERIIQLEAVTSRARQRQRWRQGQSNTQMVNVSLEPTVSSVPSEVRLLSGECSINSQVRTIENVKTGKRGSSHLIAKALGIHTDTKRAGAGGGEFFDCNICLDMARDPVLTCCGHLFCWSCFCQLPYAYRNVKECPACNGEVTDASIIPIYGNGNSNDLQKLKSKESGLKVPPRPLARRIESVRQQLINRRPVSTPIEVRIQQFNSIVDAARHQTGSLDLGAAVRSGELEVNDPLLHISRVLPASISSLSSALTSAMDSAERLVGDLEAYINSDNLRRNHQEFSHADTDSVPLISADVQAGSQSLDMATEIDSGVPPSASSVRTDVPTNIVRLQSETRDTAMEVNLNAPHSSSSRRRSASLRASDVDSGICRELRRRRLR
ncbi:hypothetical protein AB3S75_036375 [Citrus x aurantiifolia]